MAVPQVTVICDSPLEQSAGVSRLLAVNNIDIRAAHVLQEGERTIYRLIVSDPAAAIRMLRAKEFEAFGGEVLAVEIPDMPGGFAHVMDVLEKHSIRVDYLYSSLEHHKDRAVIILKVVDIPAAVAVLESNRMVLVDRF
jgi:hypothetical protein